MKVLFINCNSGGSTGNIILNISNYLKAKGHDSTICYEVGAPTNAKESMYKISTKFEPGIYRRIHYLTGIPYGFAPLSTLKLIKRIKIENPDIVHIHCPNSNSINLYTLFKWLNKTSIKVVITNHCEMFYTGNCPYSYECKLWKSGCKKCPNLRIYVGPMLFNNTSFSWKKMKKVFDIFDDKNLLIASVSKWVNESSSVSPLTNKFKNIIVENSVNTDVFKNYDFDKYEIIKKYNLNSNKKLILFVTSTFNTNVIDDRKGSKYLIDIAKKMNNEDVEFLVVGARSEIIDLPSNIRSIGRVENQQELAMLYNVADISLVLSKKETFSMVCAESLCCGTPVVGFKAGGPESISLSDFSCFCEHGDVLELVSIIRKWINFKKDNQSLVQEIIKKAKNKYQVENMCSKYLLMYKELLDNVE